MRRSRRGSASPTILLRIARPGAHMHRAFNDFARASRSGEAFAGAGFSVTMHSATGQFLMGFPVRGRAVVPALNEPIREGLASSSNV